MTLSSSDHDMPGRFMTSARKSQLAMLKVETSESAVTVAVRGPPSISAISPKKSPGPRRATVRPPRTTRTSPLRIMWKPAPDPP